MFTIATSTLLTTLALGGAPTTVTVGPSGTYSSIVDAVAFITAEDSHDGYIIDVQDGTYPAASSSTIVLFRLAGPITIQSVDGSGAVVIEGYNTNRCIWAEDVDLTLIGLSLRHGATTDNGAGVYAALGSSLAMQNVSISDCAAGDNGGGIYFDSPGSVLLSNCSFTDCSGASSGGALYANSSNVDLSSCAVTRCTAGSINHGGGLYLEAGGTLDTVTFEDCEAGWAGGVYSEAEIWASNCQFTRCASVWSDGGAVFSAASGPATVTLNFDTCSFQDNTSAGSGGAISLSGASISLFASDCSFTGNEAAGGSGGAVRCFGSAAHFTGCAIENNSAATGGGLAFKTYNGAAAMIVVVSNCTLRSNTASWIGAHVDFEIWSGGYGGMDAIITDSTLEDGAASREGAINVIAENDPLQLLISGCTLSNNTATSASGAAMDAIGVSGATADVTITSSVACDHAYELELDSQVIDGGGNTLGGWCCPGDVNSDDTVNGDDLTAFLSKWSNSSDGNDREDVDRDEAVIMLDLIAMFRNWGACD